MILVQRILFLKNVPLFSTMPPDTLAWVAEAADETSCPPGQTIFEKGSEGDSMYVIADGSVRIHDGDKTLASLPQGAFFGELSILDGETRSASASFFALGSAALGPSRKAYASLLSGVLQPLHSSTAAAMESTHSDIDTRTALLFSSRCGVDMQLVM